MGFPITVEKREISRKPELSPSVYIVFRRIFGLKKQTNWKEM
jgi:hypothetical protein